MRWRGSASAKSAGNKQPEPAKKAAKTAGPPAHRTGVEAIEAALARPISCEFVETPLKDVLDYMEDAMQVHICLDSQALKEAGVDESTPVTCRHVGLRFEKALNLILDSVQLKWTIHDDVLFVTSPAKAESDEFLETRVYDVANLVAYQDENGKKFDDYAPLTDVISSTIYPKTWTDGGGAGTIIGAPLRTAKVLAVTNRYDVHKKIAALLADIRTIAAKTSGDDLPYRERPKAPPCRAQPKAAQSGGSGIPLQGATWGSGPYLGTGPGEPMKAAAPPAKPAEKPAKNADENPFG